MRGRPAAAGGVHVQGGARRGALPGRGGRAAGGQGWREEGWRVEGEGSRGGRVGWRVYTGGSCYRQGRGVFGGRVTAVRWVKMGRHSAALLGRGGRSGSRRAAGQGAANHGPAAAWWKRESRAARAALPPSPPLRLAGRWRARRCERCATPAAPAAPQAPKAPAPPPASPAPCGEASREAAQGWERVLRACSSGTASRLHHPGPSTASRAGRARPAGRRAS